MRARGQRGIRPVVYGWTGAIALVAILSDLSFTDLVTPASILGGVFACGIYGVGLLYIDKVNLPEPYRMGRTLRTLVVLGSAFLTVCGVIAILELVGAIA